MKTLRQRLELALKDAKLTQAGLSRAVGVSRSAINQWLSGDTKTLSGAPLVKAARALNVDPLWLAEGKGNKEVRSVREDVQRYVIDPDLERVASAWSFLTSEQRAEFLRNIEAMAHTNRLVLREIGKMPNHIADETVEKHYYPAKKEKK